LLVEAMSPAGLDLFVAVSTDPECGPMLTFGLGGFLLEAIRDVVAVPLPSRQGEVAALLEDSAIGRFLTSRSGAMFGGSASIVSFAERLGDIYIATKGRLSLIELNPVRLVPGNDTPVVLDALLATKGISA
jgi:acetate---CoA ligase (ADP-forming)